MIITLILKLVSGMYAEKEWSGEIEIDESSDLEDLHFAIQSALDFDNDHLYEFYISRTERSGERVRFDGCDEGPLDTLINELFPLPSKRKLFYWFDYGDDWIFQITKSRKKTKSLEVGVTYPRLTKEVGKKPEQYPDVEW